jgi:hypothetical protein
MTCVRVPSGDAAVLTEFMQLWKSQSRYSVALVQRNRAQTAGFVWRQLQQQQSTVKNIGDCLGVCVCWDALTAHYLEFDGEQLRDETLNYIMTSDCVKVIFDLQATLHAVFAVTGEQQLQGKPIDPRIAAWCANREVAMAATV